MSESGQAKKRLSWRMWALIIFGLWLVTQMVTPHEATKASPAAPAPAKEASTNKAPSKEDHSIPRQMPDFVGEQFVSPHLKDPASAHYRNITYRTRNSLPVLCGEVNARNSFGGYTGFEYFVAMGNLVQIGGREMHDLWNTFCVHTDAYDAAHLHRHKTKAHT
jgi:hypothetical protein